MNDSSAVSVPTTTTVPATVNNSYNYNYGSVQPVVTTQHASPAAMAFGFAIFFLLFATIYLYSAYILYRLAKKTNTENPGLAWVPIINIYTMVKVAGKPGWWIILLFIPLVNIVIIILLWMNIARRVGKPDYLGILMIVPVVNLIIPAYLAFAGPVMTPPPVPPMSPIQ